MGVTGLVFPQNREIYNAFVIWALRIGTAHGCFSISHDRNACYCIRISSMDHSPKSHFGLQYSGGREGGRGLGWGIPPISKNLTPPSGTRPHFSD